MRNSRDLAEMLEGICGSARLGPAGVRGWGKWVGRAEIGGCFGKEMMITTPRNTPRLTKHPSETMQKNEMLRRQVAIDAEKG